MSSIDLMGAVSIKKHEGLSRDGHRWELYHGDANKALEVLSEESIDCAVTSPPYYWLRDYGVDGQIGMEDTVEGYVKAIADTMLVLSCVNESNDVSGF